MNMKQQIKLFFCVLTVAVSPAVMAIDGLPLMKLDVSARPAGMAGAFTAMNADPSATMYNPASAAGLTSFGASLGHVQYWDNIRLESVFLGTRISSETVFHFGIRYASDNDLEARDLTPSVEPDALFNANTASFNGGLAMQISPKISAGIGLGFFYDKIEAWHGSAFHINAGVQAIPMERVRVGAAILNVGPSYQLLKPGEVDSRDINQPLTIRVGGSYEYQKLFGALDVVMVDDEAQILLGAEGKIHPALTLRAGYVLNHDTRSFTAGTTISWRNFGLSYAIAPYKADLGLTHLFSLSTSL
jgi:hypothetical protein